LWGNKRKGRHRPEHRKKIHLRKKCRGEKKAENLLLTQRKRRKVGLVPLKKAEQGRILGGKSKLKNCRRGLGRKHDTTTKSPSRHHFEQRRGRRIS